MVRAAGDNLCNRKIRFIFLDKLSSLSALITALSDLETLCETIEDSYVTSFKDDKYEKWVEES